MSRGDVRSSAAKAKAKARCARRDKIGMHVSHEELSWRCRVGMGADATVAEQLRSLACKSTAWTINDSIKHSNQEESALKFRT